VIAREYTAGLLCLMIFSPFFLLVLILADHLFFLVNVLRSLLLIPSFCPLGRNVRALSCSRFPIEFCRVWEPSYALLSAHVGKRPLLFKSGSKRSFILVIYPEHSPLPSARRLSPSPPWKKHPLLCYTRKSPSFPAAVEGDCNPVLFRRDLLARHDAHFSFPPRSSSLRFERILSDELRRRCSFTEGFTNTWRIPPLSLFLG